MEQTGFIAAIDLGSSKIVAMAGRKNQEGKLAILYKEEIESDTCIRRGRIYNLEETQRKISSLILKLESKFPQKSRIEKIYIGIGGQSLQTEICTVLRNFTEEGGIILNEAILQSIRKECESYERDSEMLDIISAEYFLDEQDVPVKDPVGLACSSIEAQFKLIVTKPAKKFLADSLEKARTTVAGYVIGPMATANAVLNDEDKKNGCALVEIGAGVTYLSIYKQGTLKELITIPMGGISITKDIASLNISMKEAENLKIKYGTAIADPDEGNKTIPVVNPENNGPKEIEFKLLEQIIEARINEIIANVQQQLRLSKHENGLNAGIILTGGGSQLNKIAAAFRNKMKYDIRLAVPKHQLFQKAEEEYNNPAYSEMIGILLAGSENCVKVIEPAPTPPVTTPSPAPEQGSLFRDDEVKIEQPAGTGKKQDGDTKSGGGLFSRFKRGVKNTMDSASKSLFDEDLDGRKNEENTEK